MSPHERSTTDRVTRPPTNSGGLFPSVGAEPRVDQQHETRPDVIAHLERLDDLMFAAIAADPAALEQVADAWSNAVEELGAATVEESRRQYLRHAQSVWDELRRQPDQPPHKTFAAIEIISLLAEKSW